MTFSLLTQRLEYTTTADDAELAHVLEAYLTEVEAGRGVSPAELMAAHPHLAQRLEGCLASLQFLEHAGGEVRRGALSGSLVESLLDERAALGDFRLIREIGRGGMGVVYEAEQLSLGRRVAVKVLPFAAMLDQRQLARFKNEARAAASLHHPHIVPVYFVGAERGVHFDAMQYIEGETLAQAIPSIASAAESYAPAAERSDDQAEDADLVGARRAPRRAAPSPAETLRDAHAAGTRRDGSSPAHFRRVAELGIQAAEALHHAHESGVVHRDVKPSNLLVEPNGHLWIADFGLARVGSDPALTLTGDLVGTLRYMSPEQVRGKTAVVDPRTDVYSLGVTLYELLTLRPALTADDGEQLLRQVVDQDPAPPRSLNQAIPLDLETIVLKAIGKDAATRYATAQELADDLRRFLVGQPIEARRPSLAERGRKWASRHAALVTLAVSGVALIAAVVSAAMFFTLQAYRSEAQQRTAAVANLQVASDSIDRMLVRVANHQYVQGNLAEAEAIAADAAEFYEQLVAHSDDPELHFRAAEAHGTVAEIWLLVDKPERAVDASRRSIELLRPLIAAHPDEARYFNARGSAYLSLGRSEWGLGRRTNAEEPWQQAAADFQHLIDAHPHEPKYQGSLAGALNNLGLAYWVFDRVDGAEQYYQRVVELINQLPPAFAAAPEVWTAQAGTLCNWAMLLRERGDSAQALKLLEQAQAPLERALDQAPTDPVAQDFLYSHYWQTAETSVRAGQHGQAAKTVEALVWALPDRIDAYYMGAELLLGCAALADKPAAAPDNTAGHSNTTADPAAATAYRERARALLAQAHDMPAGTPDRNDRFAWFLLTCRDKSFGDPQRALELAKAAIDAAPTRGDLWLTLALANCRLGDWPAATEALKTSIGLAPGKAAGIRHLLVEAMIHFQEGDVEAARRLHKRAADLIARHQTSNEDTLTIAAEVAELITAP